MVAFVKTAYSIVENEGQVKVCVNLTQPHSDIFDDTVHVAVYRDDSAVSNFMLACKCS